MTSNFILEKDVEDIALNTLEEVGYSVYLGEGYSKPNKTLDKERKGNHKVTLLSNRLEKSLRKINPGYSQIIGSSLKSLNDHDGVTMTLIVPNDMFPTVSTYIREGNPPGRFWSPTPAAFHNGAGLP